MEPSLRPLISVITVLTAAMVPIRLVAQRMEVKPDGPTQDARAAKSAAIYLQHVTPEASAQGGAVKIPKPSGIPSAGEASAVSRGPMPSYGRQTDLGVTFRIYNYSRIPPRMLQRAEERAAMILMKGGVRTRWIQCPTAADEFDVYPDCQRLPTSEDLFVSIVPAAMSVKSASRADALGLAMIVADGEYSKYATLFFDRIQEVSQAVDVAPELVLGPAIAHEAGHLLLGTTSHSSRGVMRARWGGDELQGMARSIVGFTDAQSRQLQRNVSERSRVGP